MTVTKWGNTMDVDLVAQAKEFAAVYREKFDRLDSDLGLVAQQYFTRISDALYAEAKAQGGFTGRPPVPSYGATTWNPEETDDEWIGFSEDDYDGGSPTHWRVPWLAVTSMDMAVERELTRRREYRAKQDAENRRIQEQAKAKRIGELQAELDRLRAEQEKQA